MKAWRETTHGCVPVACHAGSGRPYQLQIWMRGSGWIPIEVTWDHLVGWHYLSTAYPTRFSCYARAHRMASAISENCDVPVAITQPGRSTGTGAAWPRMGAWRPGAHHLRASSP